MSPPIRSLAHDGEALANALSTGVLTLVGKLSVVGCPEASATIDVPIAVAGSDHAVFNRAQKAKGKGDFRTIPNGVNGIEERMHLTWDRCVNTGKMSVKEYVRATSAAAAQIFGVFPQKG